MAVTKTVDSSGEETEKMALPFSSSSSKAAASVTFLGWFQSPEPKVRVSPELTPRSVSPLFHAVVAVTMD